MLMLHANPLLRDISCDKKFITVGEIMLRLTPPNYEKLRMANNFEASYGGSEANIALALANLGIDSTFFSVVPNNSLGKSAVRLLRCEKSTGKKSKYRWLTPEVISTYYAQSLCFITEGWIAQGMDDIEPKEMAEAYMYLITRSMDDILSEL